MKQTIIYVLFLGLIFIFSPERSEGEEEKKDLQALEVIGEFEEFVTRLAASVDEQQKSLNTNYIGALNRLFARKQKEGELDQLVAIRNEIERIEKGEDPSDGGDTQLAEIKDMRASYQDTIGQIWRKRDHSFVQAASAHKQKVAGLVDFYTKRGDVETALRMREELKKTETLITNTKQKAPDDCALYYHFDDKPKEREIIDRSGNWRDGKIHHHGAWLENGYRGGGYRLRNVRDRIKIKHASVFVGDAFTLSCWVKLNAARDHARLWDKYDHAGRHGYQFCFHNARPGIEFWSSAGNRLVLSPTPLPIGKWCHVVFCYSGSSIDIYVNGKNTKSE